VVGVFGYSDEDGTEAEGFDAKLSPEVIAARVARVSALADELVNQRAEDRIGELVEVLVEEVQPGPDSTARRPGGLEVTGRAAHQAPETDGTVLLIGDLSGLRVGQLVTALVVENEGADLIAEVRSGTVR
jgi:ribosomal protein S12 methylthiotransferase